MYSYKKLPASNSLDGLMDVINFDSYWNALKGKIAELQATGLRISTYQQRIAIAQQKAWKAGDLRTGGALDLELQKIDDDLKKWWKVKTSLDTWLPKFIEIEQKQNAEKGLGVIPALVLGVSGIAALAFIVNTGLALVQDYQFKSQLTQAVIDQKISSGQMTEILSIPKEEGVFQQVVSKVGIGVGFGVPAVLLVGGGLYLLMITGGLRTVLGMFGGRASQQSNGGG